MISHNAAAVCLSLSISLVVLVAVACSQSPKPSIDTPTGPKVTMSGKPQSLPAATVHHGISSAEAALLVPIAHWHELWDDPSNGRPMDKERLTTELGDLLATIEDRLSEPLLSTIAVYQVSHGVVIGMKTNQAYRAAFFVNDAGLDLDSMDSPCDLPDTSSVPEAIQPDLDSLRLECLSIEIADEFLSKSRNLAELTWLKSGTPSVIVEASQSEAGLVPNYSDWHHRWDLGVSLSDRKGLIRDLNMFNSAISGKFEEPLGSAVKVYSLSHMLAFMIKSNLVHRAASLVSDADLDYIPMATLCGSPEEVDIPENFQRDLDLLSAECLISEMAEMMLDFKRSLDEETWLKPFIETK